MATEKKAVDFEQQLGSLEALVESLESGDLSLEDSLKSFEQGIKVARECQTALKQAEQKVELLMRQGDELVSQPFEPDE
ncbi:MAG: exodeoxyribonuclease VII small subunit [Porticoccaceae bacterium]|nr:exodeoxyribonuclease VII small subunit [Porticoccaceae bacterium]MDB2533115.1 exodeoxyribonuclease VII small subunit [Porticoccaceae bacterium]MDC0641173.1 exodeoxyribonuclease VII small subunit [Porticoccaceae bacterium]MDG1486295.1 exodeoxyribonuclease VII small subunit [Porticoccaceae bacterium]